MRSDLEIRKKVFWEEMKIIGEREPKEYLDWFELAGTLQAMRNIAKEIGRADIYVREKAKNRRMSGVGV